MLQYCKLDFVDLGTNGYGWDARLLLPYSPDDALMEQIECLSGVKRAQLLATQAEGFVAQVRFQLDHDVSHGTLHDRLFDCLSAAAGTTGVVLDFKEV